MPHKRRRHKEDFGAFIASMSEGALEQIWRNIRRECEALTDGGMSETDVERVRRALTKCFAIPAVVRRVVVQGRSVELRQEIRQKVQSVVRKLQEVESEPN